MRDAIGGLVSINIIIVFLFLINGYLAYSVNYTKAFRMKNKIIDIIEAYEGHTEKAQREIDAYMSQINYKPNRVLTQSAGSEYCCFNTLGYCIHATPAGSSTDYDDDGYRGWNYKVITFVNIDIPIFNKILPGLGKLLHVTGETAAVTAPNGQCYQHGCNC